MNSHPARKLAGNWWYKKLINNIMMMKTIEDVIKQIGKRGVATEKVIVRLILNNSFTDEFQADILAYYLLDNVIDDYMKVEIGAGR